MSSLNGKSKTVVFPWMESVYEILEDHITSVDGEVSLDSAYNHIQESSDLPRRDIERAMTHLEARGWFYRVEEDGVECIRITIPKPIEG